MPPDLINTLSLDLPAFIVGIGFHEFCHAFAADRMGDPTPREQGRVTLNPIEHLDPIGTVLPLGLSLIGSPVAFGWGKPVIVDPSRFRDPVMGYGVVALAGPLGNLLICVLTGLFIGFSAHIPALLDAMGNPTGNFLYRLLFQIFRMNLGLLLFNLLPFPPLDGSKVLMWVGGQPVREFMARMQEYSLFILMILLSTNLLDWFITPLYIRATILLTGEMARFVLRPDQFIANFL